MNANFSTSIAPWLTVPDGKRAVGFYKAAFNAVETYILDDPKGGIVVKLSINGAEFWVSSEPEPNNANSNVTPGAGTIRMILTVDNPETLFMQALRAGATEVYPLREGYGWILCRIIDPFGLHWEIGHPL